MRRFLSALIATLALCAAGPSAASAAFELSDLDVFFENKDKTPALLAGSHPFAMKTNFGISTTLTPAGQVPEGEVRDVLIEQIPGLVGSQTAVPSCSQADFTNRVEGRPSCADASAVGYAAAEVEWEVIPPAEAGRKFHVPVYSLDPPPGVAAQLGFIVLNVPITIDVKVSEAPPYNLVAKLNNVPQAILLYSSEVVLWGNPADPAHDPLRGNCLGHVASPTPKPASLGDCPVDIPQRAFLTLPRSCGGPLSTFFEATSWRGERAVGAAETRTKTEPLGIQECEDLVFTPTISSKPTSTSAESATGLDFSLEVDEKGLVDPAERAQSDIREAVATLPEGMTLNPAAANGLEACSLAEYEAESLQAPPGAGCPGSSKVGTVTVETPLLKEPVSGQLYVAEQNNNPFHSLFALYMVIKSERNGIFIKQAGRVEPDPQTGRIRTAFSEIPQLPFSRFTLHFRGGPGAPLTTPSRCGTQQVSAILTPWSGGAPVTTTSSFMIDSASGGGPCSSGLPPFLPRLEGGSFDRTAGQYSPFYVRFTRSDGEQEMTRFNAVLPPGVLGKIAGIEKCSDAAIEQARGHSGREELASPSCPQSSRIGSVIAGAGVGSSLTYVEGTLYLAGPYAGSPLSVVAITPGVAGPFDLGTVAIRETLTLNPTTAEVEIGGAASDPLPRILEGVPLHLRDLRILVDRPNFTLNATNCDAESLRAMFFGSAADLLSPADDVTASSSDHYQASGCGKLKYRPKLSLKLLGGTKRGGHPSVRALLTPRVGDANAKRAVVTLPSTEQIDNAHINNPCTRVQFAAEACPKKSILGRAKAISPLLDSPLEGPVYFRSNGGERELPDIVADLRGQFRIVLAGFIDSKRGRLRTTFANIPDAPVSRFELNLVGGKRGLLVNNQNLCSRKLRVKMRLTGQNGVSRRITPPLRTSCKGKRKRHHR